MNVVHLHKGQKTHRKFEHPVLDNAESISLEEMEQLIEGHLAGDRSATERLILGNLQLVGWLVARYRSHWPKTKPFTDDMVSEGFAALTETVNKVDEPISANYLRAKIVNKVKLNIEQFLNDNLHVAGASLRTNLNRLALGQPLEYIDAQSIRKVKSFDDPCELSDEAIYKKGHKNQEPFLYDEGHTFADILDAIERVQESDNEEIIDIVLAALEQYHDMDEASLTKKQRRLVQELCDGVRGAA